MKSSKIQIKLSEKRSELSALLDQEDRSAEDTQKMEKITKQLGDLEVELRAALTLEESQNDKAAKAIGDMPLVDPEVRERNELRGKALFSKFILAAVTGQVLNGAEAEYRAAEGVDDGIPVNLFEKDRIETRADVPTPEPTSGTGVNLDPISPFLFADSILPRLGVDMPMVGSGSFGQPRMTKAIKAKAVAKSGVIESTAGTITTTLTTPHRIGIRETSRIEDLAGSGLNDFEEFLKNHVRLSLSNKLNELGLTGSGSGNDPKGLFANVTAATAETTKDTYESVIKKVTTQIDGLYSHGKSDLTLLVNEESNGYLNSIYRGANASTSAADHFTEMLGDYLVHSQAPANSSNVGDALIVRNGQMGIRKAVMPHWGSLFVDDILTSAGSGLKHYTLNILVGDVIVAQPDVYRRISLKVA